MSKKQVVSRSLGRMSLSRKACLMLAVVPLAAVFSQSGALGATDTWTGATDGNWSTAANWTGGNAPPVAGDSLVFDGSANLTTNNDLAALAAYNGITFNSTASAFVLGGNSITLGGNIVNSNSVTATVETINYGLVLNANRTLSVAAGGSAAAGGSLTINGVISDGGSGFGLTIVNNGLNHLVASSGGVTGQYSFGVVTLTAANTYTGPTTVQSGKLLLDFTTLGASSGIVSSSSALALGSTGSSTTTAGVGALSINGAASVTDTQTFNGTTIGNGHNQITVTNGASGTANLALGSIARASGSHGTLAVTLPTTGAISGTATLSGGLLGAWATVGGDFATISGGNVVAYTGYSDVPVGNTTITAGSGVNVRWAGSTVNAGIGVAATTTEINSLLYSDNTTRTMTVAGILRFGAQGGVYRSSGAGNNGLTITGGTLTAGGGAGVPGELTLNANQSGTNNSNDLTTTSIIADNGVGNPVTVVKTGPGSWVANAVNTYTGGTYIDDGRVQMSNASAFGPVGSNVFIEPGGHLFVNVAAPTAYNYFIAGGGSHETASGGSDFGPIRVNNGNTVAGNITLVGDARISSGGANGTVTAAISGAYNIDFNGVSTATFGLTLSSTANSWTGDTTINLGTVRLGNSEVIPNGAGTGNVIINANSATLATLDLNGKNETINGLNSSATSVAGGFAASDVVTNTPAGTAVLTLGDNNASGNFAGVIQNGTTGITAITKIGAGTQILGGANTYTGNTTVTGGTLSLTGSLASGNISVGTSGTLTMGASAAIAATTNLTVNGIANLSNNPTIGSLNGTTGGASVNLRGSSLTVNNGGSYAGAIVDTVGGGTLSLGGGTLVLAGANTFAGTTNVNGGALVVNGSLSSGANLMVNAGILSGNGTVGNVNSVASLRAGPLATDNSVGTLTMNSLSVLGGDMRVDLVTPANADKFVVSGVANFAAASTITPTSTPQSGTYVLLTAASLTGTAPTMSVAGGTTRTTYAVHFGDLVANQLELVVAGGPKTITWTGTDVNDGTAWDLVNHINWTDGAIAEKFFNLDAVVFSNGPTNRTINISGNVTPTSVTVSSSAGSDYSFNGGTIADSGFVGGTSLTKSGTGNLTLNNSNTYAGATAIQNGKIILGSATALPTGTALTLGTGASSGVLDLAGNSISVSLLATSGTGALNVISSSTTSAAVTVTGGNTTFAGSINDNFGVSLGQQLSLSLTGNTSVTLTGTNTYTGATSINAASTLQVGGGGTTGSIGSTTITDNGNLIYSRSNSVTVAATISGTGNLRQSGAGTLILTGANSYVNTTIDAGGTLQVDNGGANGSLGSGNVTNNGLLVFDRTDAQSIANTITGTGGVNIAAGNVTLASTTNNYSGATNVASGATVVANNSNSFGTIPGGNVTIASGGSLQITAAANALNFGQKLFLLAGTGVDGNGVLQNIGASNQQNAFQQVKLTGNATFGGSARIDIRANQSGGLNTAKLDLNGNTLTKEGTFQFILVNTDVTDGSIVVNNGLLSLEGTTSIPASGTGGTITINATTNAVTLQCFANAGDVQNIQRAMVFDGPVIMGNNSNNPVTIGSPILLNGDLTINTINGNGTGQISLTGNISETGGPHMITKNANGTGNATTILSGANTFTGGLTINSGVILANNVSGSATGSGNVTLNAGTLGGSGSVAGAVTAAAGSNISPGNAGIGTLTVGSASIAGNLNIELNDANVNVVDVLNDLGALTLSSATLNFTVVGTPSHASYVLAHYASLTGDPFATVNNLPANYVLDYNYHSLNEIALVSTIIVGPANLTWNNTGGTGDGVTFDTAGQQNWNNGTGTAQFAAGDNVTFNDTNNGHYNVTISGSNAPGAVVVSNSTGNYAFSGSGSIGGNTSLTKSGTGSLTISNANTYSGGTVVSGGTLIVANTGALGTGGLTVHTGATARLQAGLASAVSAPSVTLDGTTNAWSGTVDITNNKLIIQDSATHATSFTNAKNQATTGNLAATGVSAGKVVVVLDNNVEGLATFGGVPVNNNSILAIALFPGDTNFDGKVNITDLNTVGGHWLASTSKWSFGDFNGDGKVNITDLNTLGGHWLNGGAGGESFADALASIPAFAGLSSSAVPEPASLAVLGVAAAALLTRRRKV